MRVGMLPCDAAAGDNTVWIDWTVWNCRTLKFYCVVLRTYRDPPDYSSMPQGQIRVLPLSSK